MKPTTLQLLSENGGPELTCEVVAEIDFKGEPYVLLAPTTPMVTVVRDDPDGVEELMPEKFTEDLSAAFAKVLASRDLRLSVHDDEYQLVGEITDEIADLCDSLTIGEDGDDDAHLILAEVEQGGGKYLLLSPETPAMFAAKVVQGKAVPLSDDELEKVEDQLAEALEE